MGQEVKSTLWTLGWELQNKTGNTPQKVPIMTEMELNVPLHNTKGNILKNSDAIFFPR